MVGYKWVPSRGIMQIGVAWKPTTQTFMHIEFHLENAQKTQVLKKFLEMKTLRVSSVGSK